MSDMNETKDRVADAPGKRALLEAALRLGSSSRSLGAIGLRELAREAGLNRTPSIGISAISTILA